MIMEKAQIEYIVYEWCKDSSIEIVESYDWDGNGFTGLEFNLYDYLKNRTAFRLDIVDLINYLEDILDANIFVSEPSFKELKDIDNEKEIIKYHCFLRIGKNC